MQQLLFEEPGTLRWDDVAEPSLDGPTGADAAIVRAIRSARRSRFSVWSGLVHNLDKPR